MIFDRCLVTHVHSTSILPTFLGSVYLSQGFLSEFETNKTFLYFVWEFLPQTWNSQGISCVRNDEYNPIFIKI